MAHTIPDEIVRKIRDRQLLLWVCQPYDLLPGATPHSLDLPEAEAVARYRGEAGGDDRRLAGKYWEAVWLEGAVSPLLAALREESERGSANRPTVILASDADVEAQFSSREFLAVSVLPGVADPNVASGSRYASMRRRARERVAQGLAERLEKYPGRALIVIGARDENDLDESLYPTLEVIQLLDLHVLVVWPEALPVSAPPDDIIGQLTFWRGETPDLLDALDDVRTPDASDIPSWSVRLGGGRHVSLSPRETQSIPEKYALLTEDDLLPPEALTWEDLEAFLSNDLGNWKAYCCGLPVPRAYSLGEGRTLTDEVLSALEKVHQEDGGSRSFVLQLPCEGGAGGTTLIRQAAHRAAREGYPTLVLRRSEVDVDVEGLAAFATSLLEAARGNAMDDTPPLLLVFDTEHSSIPGIDNVGQSLGAQGRRAVILQATPYEGGESGQAPSLPRRSRRRCRVLPPLLSDVRPEEVRRTAEIFADLREAWSFPYDVRSLGDWNSYEQATRWTTPDQQDYRYRLFWVALRFFITHGLDFAASERVHDALGQWIQQRHDRIADPDIVEAVDFVAALSSFRIVCPFKTAFRKAARGAYSTKLMDSLRGIGELVEWGPINQELDDSVLYFRHPALAEEYLRRKGVRDERERVELLCSLLRELRPGSRGDRWVAETLATQVLVPDSVERRSRFTQWEWRLRAFETLRTELRDESKTLLHHWARCIYNAARPESNRDLGSSERLSRYQLAIEKLSRAIEKPKRPERDEHPSHLYNTLGTVNALYADEVEASDRSMAAAKWKEACEAFQKAVDFLPGNVKALLAFSKRLLDHAGVDNVSNKATQSQMDEVAEALALLGDAEEVLGEIESPDPSLWAEVSAYRSRALGWLSNDLAVAYIHHLKSSDSPELGYYCEAQLLARDEDEDRIAQALELFEEAESLEVELGARTIRFRLTLLRKHPERKHDFPLQCRLYDDLERLEGSVPSLLDQFRHAVLCYQTGSYQDGARRFEKLRNHLYRSDSPKLYAVDYWRAPEAPEVARPTFVRVRRWITQSRAEGYVDDLRQSVRLQPRHFDPTPQVNEVRPCIVRFTLSGPLAVPERFGPSKPNE